MKTPFFLSAILILSLLAVLTSCNNKVADSTPQYIRGGNSVVLGDDGNVVVAGYNSSATQGYQATLVKVNTSDTGPDTLWTRTYGGSYSDAFFNVKKVNKGEGYIATGFRNQANAGSPTMFVVITDAAGTAKYSLTYGGSAYTEGFGIVPNADSGYLIAGFIQKSSTSDRDIYLVRIRDDGTVIWEKSIGATSADSYDTVNDAAYGVIAAPDGGYFITGSLNGGYNMNGGKIFLMKVSSSGDSLWTKTYGTGFGYSLALTHSGGIPDGGVAISGSIINGNSQDVFLIKTDTDGNPFPLWSQEKTYGGSGFEYGATMVETSDGGFAITGITEESSGHGQQDVYLILTNSLGEVRNGSPFSYGGSNNDQGYGLVQASNNDFFITGLSNSGGSYIYLNRVDVNGGQLTGWPKLIK